MANPFLSLFAQKEEEYGLPQGYLLRTAQVESGLNPRAKNPRSSAGGLFQFIDSTAAEYGLSDKFDPEAATDAAAQLASDNAERLRKVLGREPTAGELYLAHQQGGGGAAKLLANPDAPAAALVGAKAVALNGGNAAMRAGDFANKWISKVDGGKVSEGTIAERQRRAAEDDTYTEPTGGLGGLGGYRPPPAEYASGRESGGFDAGNLMGALGAAILAGNRDQPINGQVMAQMVQAQNAAMERREDRRYGMQRDERDFGFRQTEAERAKAEADRRFGLQERNQSSLDEARKRDDTRAEAQLEEAKLGELGRKMRLLHPDVKPGTEEYRRLYKELLSGDVRTSLSPIYGVDAEGRPVVMQPSTDGRMVRSTMPEGVQVSKDPIRVDAGTQTILLDPITRQQIGAVPKNVGAVTEEKERGEAKVKAEVALPSAEAKAQVALKAIEDIRNHPWREFGTGKTGVVPRIPGTPQADFVDRVEQLKGTAFLQAFETLKGGGAISEKEGQKAEQAFARLSRSNTEEGFLAALKDLEDVIKAGVERSRKAGGAPPAEAKAAPAASPLLDEARAAIARGAPRDKVIQRLRDRGVDPAGL